MIEYSEFLTMMRLSRCGWTKEDAAEMIRQRPQDKLAIEVASLIGPELAQRFGLSQDRLIAIGRLVQSAIQA
jgi:hypothetical protein